MSETDPHAPTHAGPQPEPAPVTGASEAAPGRPPGSVAAGGPPIGPPIDEHPERKVGAAFAGGLVAAMFLKRLARRRQR